MNRRSVLGILGIGAAAGPAIASSALSGTSSNTVAPGIPFNDYGAYSVKQSISDSIMAENPVERLAYLKKEYEYLVSSPDSWTAEFINRELQEIRDGYSSIRLDNIDPDIRAMKSFTESAKIRLAIKRRAAYKYENSKSQLLKSIEQLLRITT